MIPLLRFLRTRWEEILILGIARYSKRK